MFNVLKVHKAHEEFIWEEYIKFLNICISIVKAKENLVTIEKVSINCFVDRDDNFSEQIDELIREIQEGMTKQMYAIMSLGWYNDK